MPEKFALLWNILDILNILIIRRYKQGTKGMACGVHFGASLVHTVAGHFSPLSSKLSRGFFSEINVC